MRLKNLLFKEGFSILLMMFAMLVSISCPLVSMDAGTRSRIPAKEK